MAELADRVAAAIESDDAGAARALLADAGAAVGPRDGRGRSLLLLALFHRLGAVAAEIAELRGDDLDALEAAATGRNNRLAALLEADAAAVLAARTAEGFDAIGLAAFLGGSGAVALLLAHGADPDGDPDNQLGVRPVHAAAAVRDAASMRRLLDAGADPDSPQRGGIVALHAAAMHDDLDTLLVLLEHGADPHRRADDGRDARAFAEAAGSARVLAALTDPA